MIAILTVYHGRISQQTATFTEVEGVAVLNFKGSPVDHSFDCSTTVGSPSDLVWQREGGVLRFPTIIRNLALGNIVINSYSMNLSPGNRQRVTSNDLGIYTCVNTVTNERASINITGGILHFCLNSENTKYNQRHNYTCSRIRLRHTTSLYCTIT